MMPGVRAALDAEGSDAYSRNARAYQEELDELHLWIERQVGQIPAEGRHERPGQETFRC